MTGSHDDSGLPNDLRARTGRVPSVWILRDVFAGSRWHRRGAFPLLFSMALVAALLAVTTQLVLPWAVYAGL